MNHESADSGLPADLERRLHRGREIAAPPELLPRILAAATAERAAAPRPHAVALRNAAALLIGAATYLGAAHLAGPSPAAHDHAATATPVAISDLLEPRLRDDLLARLDLAPELQILRGAAAREENPR
jgi:hypothetical protein